MATNGFREDLGKTGYSQEEVYFNRLNRELIRRRRPQLDSRDERRPRGAPRSIWEKVAEKLSRYDENWKF